jgi:hypothetical protein
MANQDSPLAERRWRRFVVAAMSSPITLPALGGAILGAAVLGIHLGESSIGLINPIYFQGPALHPRERGVAIDENALPPRQPAYAQLYGWDQGNAARAADCGDCAALEARDAYARPAVYSAEVPYFGSREELRSQDMRAPVARRASYEVEPEPEYAAEEVIEPKSPVLRYAYYPVEEPVEPADEPEEPASDKYYAE